MNENESVRDEEITNSVEDSMQSEQSSEQLSEQLAEESKSSVADHVKSRSIWLRLFFMFVVALLYSVSRVVVGAVVLLQFFWVLFSGETNKNLLLLGDSLSTYTYQIIRYLTFNTEERPFPFDVDWPKAE